MCLSPFLLLFMLIIPPGIPSSSFRNFTYFLIPLVRTCLFQPLVIHLFCSCTNPVGIITCRFILQLFMYLSKNISLQFLKVVCIFGTSIALNKYLICLLNGLLNDQMIESQDFVQELHKLAY